MHRRTSHVFVLVFALLYVCSVSFAASASLPLTEEEQAFIASHPTIRIGIDPKFVPFEFINAKGVHSGISADLLALLSERTGLVFTYDPNLDWTQTVQKARDREIDVLSAVGYTQARNQYLTFLEPYLQFQRAIVVKNTNTSITDFADLADRQVAVQQDSSHEGFLQAYPQIHPRLYATVEAALLAVNQGEEVAFLGNEATSVYLSRTLGLTELRFIPITEGGKQELHFAVRNDWPLLASILQKGLNAISESEFSEILNRWIRYEVKPDYLPFLRITFAIGSIFLIMSAVSLFWAFRLRKAVKEKDLAQKEAQTADQEKSRFLARISHEIRTPLNGIRGTTYLLEKTQLNDQQRRYTTTISHATQTMQTIINDILEYSRLDEDRVILEKVPFTLDDVLHACISIETYQIHQKGLVLHLEQAKLAEQNFLGDPTRLTQVIINLLNNAIKFTEEGSITIAVGTTKQAQNQCTLNLSVRDTGIGMDKEQLFHIFQPFVQANETINRKYGGSGLGLSIVKGLVEKMGGSLSVESEPGVGSTFTVLLPLELDMQGLEEEKQRKKAIDFSSHKALLVLQDMLLSERVQALLEDYQMQSEGVTSTKLAAQILQGGEHFDLLIVECNASHPSCSLLKETLSGLGTHSPKVLALVQEEMIRTGQPSAEETADLTLPLPLVNSVLLNALLQLLGRGAEQTQETIQESKETRSMGAYTILVVEDNVTNQIIAKELLEQAGYTVHLANNGKQGYELFLKMQNSVDLVLMDLHMEVMDGYEASRLIRQKHASLPILVTSADLMGSVRTKCREVGVTDLIGKPYDPGELLVRIKTLIASYRNQRSIDYTLGLKMVGSDPKIYALVLQSFIAELDQLITDLERVQPTTEYTELFELVHRCKGSCASVGALRAQKLCIQIQGLLEQHSYQEVEAYTTNLINELRDVLAAARSYAPI
ncbi:ATP-binding protein [Sphaerochaeta sp.]|uniref:ATP-binding protein n=1 Tax=Sphaerochaeta sp. TaxID=1972642 RepID=UPI002FCA94A3